MKVGVVMMATADGADTASVAKKVEQLGFDSFWLPEHPILPVHYTTKYPLSDDGRIPDFYGQMVDPLVGLACAASVTSTIKLATGICLIPERDTLVTAKAVATLDHFRMAVCCSASGWAGCVRKPRSWVRSLPRVGGVPKKVSWP